MLYALIKIPLNPIQPYFPIFAAQNPGNIYVNQVSTMWGPELWVGLYTPLTLVNFEL